MGNRGSKSVLQTNIVKEQRVYGSWCVNHNLMHLRYTLMGFERNYPVKIPSKQLNKLSFSILAPLASQEGIIIYKKKFLSNNVLNSWFLTGIVDAEGCFQIQIRQDKRQTLKWRVSPAFKIKLHIKDISILENIQKAWGVGTITKDNSNMANYNVWSVKELQVIVDHFDKFSLVTAKHYDFLIFKQCF
uniref:LAGLIDADG endonuclease type 1 n=1 Tax=Amanita thiersii TaxID=235537 RepID=A0A5Q0N4J3_9AGAR|nr:LAGLIDADG endonuclease type 1 [Amanita thiersii]QFZ98717.1 LAGLIDADG endonuclease type 1 [Amanita thiersii]